MESKSHVQEIKSYLERGGSFTKLEGIRRFRYLNIGDAVHVLRNKHDMDIQTEMVLRNGKRVALYSLKS